MDYTFDTLRPEREHTCPACRYQRAGELSPMGDSPPDHTCRTAPSEPRSALQERRRISARIRLDRELRIRSERLADLDRARG